MPPEPLAFDSPSVAKAEHTASLSPGSSSGRPKEATHWPGVGHVPIPEQITVAKRSGVLIGQVWVKSGPPGPDLED